MEKQVFTADEQIEISYNNAPGLYQDWIGIYELSDTPNNGVLKTWEYVSGNSGSQIFDALPEGNYFTNYFLTNGYKEPGERIYFSVGNATSVNTEIIDKTFNIYPNPNNGQFIIELQRQYEKVEISIFSVSGNKVYYSEWINSVQSNKKTIHLDKLNQGIYFVHLSSAKASYSKKLVIRY